MLLSATDQRQQPARQQDNDKFWLQGKIRLADLEPGNLQEEQNIVGYNVSKDWLPSLSFEVTAVLEVGDSDCDKSQDRQTDRQTDSHPSCWALLGCAAALSCITRQSIAK